MAKEKISIILPTYNRAHILGRSLESVLAQTYPWFEVILVDDGSTDNTKALVESYEDKRIHYFNAGLNQGAAAARNYGLERAECDYIAFQDSDDVWHKDKLEKQMKALKANEQAGFCYHKMRYDFGEGKYAVLPDERVPLTQKSGDIYGQLLYENMVSTQMILARRECIRDTGLFDPEFKAMEDYDYALRMASGYRAVFVDEILLEAAYSDTGVSGNAVNYLLASCRLIRKYKTDYLKTDTFNHRVEAIIRDSEAIGMQEQFVRLLEQILREGA